MEKVTGYQCRHCHNIYIECTEAANCEKRCLVRLIKHATLKLFDKERNPIRLDERVSFVTGQICYVWIESDADVEILKHLAPDILREISSQPGLYFRENNFSRWANLTIMLPLYEEAYCAMEKILNKC